MGFRIQVVEEVLLKAAARIWPTRFHEDMLIEEVLELQERTARLAINLLHYRRNRIDMDLMAEEIADVQICIEQFIECHNLRDIVTEIRRGKMERLSQRINSENYEHR